MSVASENSMFTLLRIPSIVMMSLITFVGASLMGFFDVTLSVFLVYKVRCTKE